MFLEFCVFFVICPHPILEFYGQKLQFFYRNCCLFFFNWLILSDKKFWEFSCFKTKSSKFHWQIFNNLIIKTNYITCEHHPIIRPQFIYYVCNLECDLRSVMGTKQHRYIFFCFSPNCLKKKSPPFLWQCLKYLKILFQFRINGDLFHFSLRKVICKLLVTCCRSFQSKLVLN